MMYISGVLLILLGIGLALWAIIELIANDLWIMIPMGIALYWLYKPTKRR